MSVDQNQRVMVEIAPEAGPEEAAYVADQVAEFSISLVDSELRQDPALYLRWNGHELYIEMQLESRRRLRAAVDFSAVLNDRARRLTRRQPFAKAVGCRAARIMDATAGFGQDALLLALAGHQVTAIERSPVVQALLEDGVRRARAHSEFARLYPTRLRFERGDGREWLARHPNDYDAVYLDPMFPPRRKSSALPNKRVQLLKRLAGDKTELVETESAELLALALRAARLRVIVKRPHDAPPLVSGAVTPDARIKSKLVRYDVYLCAKLASRGP